MLYALGDSRGLRRREGSMRRKLACVVFAVFLATAVWPASAFAQQVDTEQKEKAAEFSQLYERWKQVQDLEEIIALGEQALALEAALRDWPLQAAREHIKGELWFDLGNAYTDRIRGDRAD